MFRDGYFYPGDMAVQRTDGRVRILGRAADVINVQGRKIAVGPIEQKIQQQLQAEEVCVFSGVNDAGQDELVIAIQSDQESPREKLVSLAEEFNHFESVRFAVLKKFPRTDAGGNKVRRSVLQKIVFSNAATKDRDG
jgi:acyl-coenzyme A synthetase/AMP-(fatty) acid ligase